MKRIKEKKFRDFYLTHTNPETKKKFSLSERKFWQIVKFYGLRKKPGRPKEELKLYI